MLENATRICEAKFGIIFWIDDGNVLRAVAHSVPPALVDSATSAVRFAWAGSRSVASGGQKLVHVADLRAETQYRMATRQSNLVGLRARHARRSDA